MMKLHTRRITLFLALFLAIVAAALMVSAFRASAAKARRPLAMPVAATLPATTCAETAPGERTCELWAKTGSVSLPNGGTTPIWGFASQQTDPASVPGPPLIVNEGDAVTVILHNEIADENVSLSFTGQPMAPDLVGITAGETVTYTFAADNPGTFKYEAGLTPNGARQVAMGLASALIIRSATAGAAYNNTTSAYDDESLLILNEIDPDFNADPNGANTTEYAPKYWLINGKAYSQTEKILTTPGSSVLLRIVNAGLQEHSIGVLGMHQTVIASDGYAKPYPFDVVAYTMAAGETLDTLVDIPADAVANSDYAVYSTGLQQLHNNGDTAGVGGIFTFIEASGGAARPAGGPLTENIAVSPNPTAGKTAVTIDATINSSTTSNLDIVAWEYFLNDVGVDGTGNLFTLTPAGTTISVTTAVPTTTLAALPAGDVTVYVHGQDSAGVWGPVNSTILDLVVAGPMITGLTVDSPANGSKDIAVAATADSTPTGEIDVVAAEYFIDAVQDPGTGISMTLNTQAPITSLSATIDAAIINGLSHGTHTVYVRAQDALGNWGAPAAVTLNVDKVGPTAVGVSLSPNPTNGTQAVNSTSNGVRLEIDATDDSGIAEAEGFINYIDTTETPDGSGFPLIAKDALYDSNYERAYFDIPLLTIRQMPNGEHPISFHARDEAGNWGAVVSLTLTIDHDGPAISNLSATPNPTPGGESQIVTLTADLTDLWDNAPGTNIVAAEWFVDSDPGFGNGFALAAADGAFDSNTESVTGSFNVTSWFSDDYTLYVRALDGAGNWSDVASMVLTVNAQTAPVMTENFETGNTAAWSAVVGDVTVVEAAGIDGTYGAQVNLNSGSPSYLIANAPISNNTACYSTSFAFRTSNAAIADEMDIFQILTGDGVSLFGLTLEESLQQGHEMKIWAAPADSSLHIIGEGVHLNNSEAWQILELRWHIQEDRLEMMLNGEIVTTLNEPGISAEGIKAVWLGASTGLEGANGMLYYDNYIAQPCTYAYFFPVVFAGGQ